MRDVFDIYTIIFLALAVFIFLRLRSVLGQRTGRERPPYDPYSAREPVRPAPEKVVALPNRTPESVAPKPAEPAEASPERWKGIAEAGSAIAAGLDAVASADANFDGQHFLTGARAAYEMIVNAYAEGDRRTLKNLLAREVYDGFESAINEREKRGETIESRFVSIDHAEITAAELRGRNAQQGRQCDRRQCRKGDRHHRRLDLRARHIIARSELEIARHRSRAMIACR